MRDAPRYEIATVDDFCKVPEDRINTCLSEFALFLRMMRPMTDMIGTEMKCVTFTWIDDGERNTTWNLEFVEPET